MCLFPERLEAKTGGQLHKLTDKDIANEERITGKIYSFDSDTQQRKKQQQPPPE
jgi:hypothetical protein